MQLLRMQFLAPPLPLTPTLSPEWERGSCKTPTNRKPFSRTREKVPDRADEG